MAHTALAVEWSAAMVTRVSPAVIVVVLTAISSSLAATLMSLATTEAILYATKILE